MIISPLANLSLIIFAKSLYPIRQYICRFWELRCGYLQRKGHYSSCSSLIAPGAPPHLNLPKARGQGCSCCNPWKSAPWGTDQGQEEMMCSSRANRNHPVQPLHPSVFKIKARGMSICCKGNLVDSVQVTGDLYNPVGPPTPTMRRLHLPNIKFGRKGRSTYIFYNVNPIMWFSMNLHSKEKAMKHFLHLFQKFETLASTVVSQKSHFLIIITFLKVTHNAQFESAEFLLITRNASCPRYFQIK